MRFTTPLSPTTGLFAAALAAVVFAWPQQVRAQAGVRYKVEKIVQQGEGNPAVVFTAKGKIAEATVTLQRSDGETKTETVGPLGDGESVRIPVEQPKGTYGYDVDIEGEGADGSTIETSFEVEMTVLGELELDVAKDRAAIASGKLTMTANRPVERVEMAVADDSGRTLRRETFDIGGDSGPFQLEWESVDDVASIRLKAVDTHGFWRSVLLEPFWVKIPHKEVNFEFGKATWKEKEVDKLESSLENIREAMREHADKGLEMQLYVAGYTDTVGSKAENRKLSERRAKAIAAWFRNNGLDIPVYYQGFGEEVLAVETPDETKNAENRRAVYILGNATPPTSETIPEANWRRVR